MHGRVKREVSAAEIQLQQEKAVKYKKLLALTLASRGSPSAIELTAQLLRLNPDVQTAWGMRREVLLSSTLEVSVELELTADCIRRNSKSYGAWHHRQWICENYTVDLSSELDLCAQLLKLDARNFHW